MLEYFAPSQVTIYLNGYYVEDACRIAYAVQDEKTPVYGYNDYRFRSTWTGRTLVQGQLDIYFRHQGYLFSVMDAAPNHETPKRAFDFPNTLKRLLKQAIFRHKGDINPSDLATFAATAVAQAAKSGDDTMKKEVLKALEQAFWYAKQTSGDRPSTRSFLSEVDNARFAELERYNRPSRHGAEEAYITLHFGSIEEYGSKWTTKRLVGVRFSSESMMVSADVPDDGRPLVESYQFIARDVLPGNTSR